MPYRIEPPKGKYRIETPAPQEDPSLMQRADQAFAQIPGSSVLAEFASAGNRSIADIIDFFGPDVVNSVLGLSGSDARMPTMGGAVDALGVGQTGYMEPGLGRDVVQAAGKTVPMALGVGQAMRSAASMIPEGASVMGNVVRQMGQSAPLADAASGALSGAGGEVGEAIGGEPGRVIGSVALPLAGAGAAQAVSSMGQGTRSLLTAASPGIDALKGKARELYAQIDGLGITVPSRSMTGLSDDLVNAVRKEGFNAKIHPKVAAVLDEFSGAAGKPMTYSDLDVLRQVARQSAMSNEPSEARLGAMMIDKIDDFMDDIPGINDPSGKAGMMIRHARDLWGRARRGERIEQAFYKAQNQASGLENGIRIQFRQILNNPKQRRGFSKPEIEAMEKVVRGGGAENIAKALGKFGLTEGQATSMLLGSLGIAGGAAVGGPAGAVAVPVIGQGFKKLAQLLTRRNAGFADALTRAGKDGLAIARAYAAEVPKSQRSVEELTGLLLERSARVDTLQKSGSAFGANAALLASWVMNAEKAEEPPPAPEPQVRQLPKARSVGATTTNRFPVR